MMQAARLPMPLLGALLFAVLMLRIPSASVHSRMNLGYVWMNHAVARNDAQAQSAALRIFEPLADGETEHNREARRTVGHLYLLQHNEEKAIATWQAMHEARDMVGELHGWANKSKREDNDAAALQWYRRAIALSAGDQWEEAIWLRLT